MYRNNSSKSFKSPMNSQQVLSEIRTDNEGNIAESRKSFEQTSVRSTKKILNLFKKPIAGRDEDKPKENIPVAREEEEEEANLVKQDLPAKEDLSAKQSQPTVPSNDKIIFNVVMGKMSTRKHKRWEDDGTLEVTGKYAVLKDSDGNIIRRTTVNPEALVEGFRMCLDSKEVEIIDRATPERLAEKDASARERIPEPPAKKLKTSGSTPFLPLGSLRKGVVERDPLVMPSINISKDWTKGIQEKETEVRVDSCLANELRTHQRHGIVFLYECIMGSKVADYFGAILADEMGLGKTLQCIAVIWTLLKKGPHGRPTLKNVLIVTPSSLCSNWNKEFKRWLGFHRLCPYVVDAKNKPKDFKKHQRNSVMIISYEMLIRCREEIEKIEFDLMVCDEGHRLKNNDIKAAKVLSSLKCKRRILLTGTPMQNDLQEFFALIDFVNPGILGSNSEFKSYYENPIVASRCPNAAEHVLSLGQERANELHEQTKRFVLRRTQETINKYLPSKHELIVFCRLSDEQTDLYSRITESWFDSSALASSVPHLTVITALKKICNHPELFYNDKNEALHSGLKKPSSNFNGKKSYHGKVSIVQTLMRNLKKTDEKLVLISYYTQTLDLLENVCIAESLQFLRLDGSTTSSARAKIIERFNSKGDNSKVFLLSAKAGGVGLNLPGASRLVLFDSDWNPASDSQAMARIWRDGQKKDVYVIRLLTRGTIEEKIFQRQISKAGLSETVVDSNSFASMKLSTSELKDLFTLTTNTACLTHDLMKCSCDGRKKVEEPSKASDQENDREYQFVVEDDGSKSNLSINQLLKWEHYRQPFPDQLIKDLMLSEESENLTFILKNSVLNKAR